MAKNDDRTDRLARQLRANLARRKQGRREAAPTDDQCASASDPSDSAAPTAS